MKKVLNSFVILALGFIAGSIVVENFPKVYPSICYILIALIVGIVLEKIAARPSKNSYSE